ncbi:5996_t:CDS:2 [Acaulospora colombiana]|uniref:5996_t:CDS:1 n=1 Tax=Acaulospora colombiana TaxID=27376 RepID=A0ACA9L8M3_9GLOM|nr:5996_t:CDS:2 [Acaulospora colombiana]
MSKRQQVGRQQVAPAAYEIRFSTTDSGVELFEIPPPNQERSVPDPFKKRDKIPRNSGSGLTLEGFAQNASTPTSPTNKQNNVSLKNKLSPKDLNNSPSNGLDVPIRSMERQERKGIFADRMEVDETIVNLSSAEKRNRMDDEPAAKHVQNNKKRPLPAEENGSDKENGYSTKDTSTQNLTHSVNKDSYVTAETVVPSNKENMIKNNNKNRKTIMSTEIKDNDVRTASRPMDGFATPPATPPSSRPMTPQGPQSSLVDVPQATSKTREIPPLPSPPSSAGSLIAYDSTQPSMASPSRIPRLSPSRPILTAYMMERPTISHDEMIIPTIAKKLKMNGQLPYHNHDALLGVSDEQDLSSESDQTDVANQSEDSLDVEQQKLPEREASSISKKSSKILNRVRQGSAHSRKDSERTNSYIQVEETLDSIERVPKSDEDKKRKRKSRREEYVLVIRDEDEADEFGEIAEPRYSTSLTPSEPSMSTTTTLLPSERDSAEHEHDENKSDEIDSAPSLTQSAQQETNTPNSTTQMAVPNKASPPLALELERTFTSGPNERKPKKHKKIKNKKSKESVVDDDDVKKSICCCTIC